MELAADKKVLVFISFILIDLLFLTLILFDSTRSYRQFRQGNYHFGAKIVGISEEEWSRRGYITTRKRFISVVIIRHSKNKIFEYIDTIRP